MTALAVKGREMPWTYQRGMPDRSGLAQFTHLIMWKHDPKETMGRGAGKRDSQHWKKTLKNIQVEDWVEKILALMSDGEPRTFNCICIQLTGTHGSVWAFKAPDEALWFCVRIGRLAWACEEGCVFFCDASKIDWSTP